MMQVDYQALALPTIEREVVEQETNIKTLAEWAESLRVVESELYTSIQTISLADQSATLGMARKMAYVRIARRWVNDRLLALGEEVPDDAMGRKFRAIRQHLTHCNQQLEKKNKRVKSLLSENSALKAAQAELLEALEAMVASFGGFRTYEGEKPSCIAKADAAIAKAKGEA